MIVRGRLPSAICLAAVLGACGGYTYTPPTQDVQNPTPTTSSSSGLFSEEELSTMRTELAVLDFAPPADPTNAYADDPGAKALGKILYFEPGYSGNGQVSCATCHDPRFGFQDAGSNTSLGLGYTGRHAPTVINCAYYVDEAKFANWMFWDGRMDSMWSQAMGPPESDTEMGGSRLKIAYLIYDRYRSDYESVFGPMPVLRDSEGVATLPTDGKPGTPEWDSLSAADQSAITRVYVNFGKAIAAFEREVVSRGSRYDAFLAEIMAGADDSDHLDLAERRGLKVFVGKGLCVDCHKGALLGDGKFRNIGLSQEGPHLPGVDRGREDGIGVVIDGTFNCMSEYSDHPDKASCAVATLESVVDHYDRGGDDAGTFSGERHRKVQPLGLTDGEKADLVAFMRALDGEPLPASITTPPRGL